MKKRKENLLNIPNPITLIRVVLSFVLVYLVFMGVDIWTIVILFAIAAFTDFLDGFLARKLKQETIFGRKFDMFADRVLMISVVVAIILYFNINNLLTKKMILEIGLILAREIIATPLMLIGLIFRKNIFPYARKIAKFTTLMQGISFPMILLNWQISIYFVILTAITGLISGILYGYDLFFNKKYK